MIDKGGMVKSSYFKVVVSEMKLFFCRLLVGCLAVLLSSMYVPYFLEPVFADVLTVEILPDIKTANTSGTTSTNRWPTATLNQPVTFTITGESLANVSATLTGKKYGVLVMPSQLANKVKANGQAHVNTILVVDLSKVAVLNATLTAVNNLVKTLGDITNGLLGSLVGVSLNFTEVNKQLALLNSFGNFGQTNFDGPLTLSTDGRTLSVSIDDGIGPILASSLSTILTNLSNAVGSLNVTGTGVVGIATALAANAALSLVKGPVVTAITNVVPALTGAGSGVQQLADASVLGKTTITMPTLVSGPGSMTADVDAKLNGTVIRSTLIDVNLLSQGQGVNYLYFRGERQDWNQTLLPDNLDFGSHTVQTKLDEQFTALNNGLTTTGKVEITDTRVGAKNWQLKVRQSQNWLNSSQSMATPILKVSGGALVSDFPPASLTSISQSAIQLSTNVQKDVLTVSNTTATGKTSLDLSKFELLVPKNTKKTIGRYSTTLVWTISDSP